MGATSGWGVVFSLETRRDGTEAWGGGSAVVRLSSACPPPTLWAGGVQVLPAVGGEPVCASGG